MRIVQIDAMRALCILYIVGYWHLFNYTSAFPGFYNAATVRLTVAVLGLFVLVSGYLAGQRGREEGAMAFYRARFLRIYPLYLLALALFGFFRIADWQTLTKAALLVSMFAGPPPPTLWFITMIMLFYLATPWLLALQARKMGFFVWCGLAVLVLYGGRHLGLAIDVRLAMYLPCYFLGLYLARQDFASIRLPFSLLGAGAVLGLVVSLPAAGDMENSFLSLPWALAGAAVLFALCRRMLPGTRLPPLVGIVSTASYAMYLLHRPLFMLFKKVYFPAEGLWQVLYLAGFALPLVIVLSWLVQHAYDRSLRHLPRLAVEPAQ